MLAKIQNSAFFAQFNQFCHDHALLNDVTRVVVAFSGGADSTALLACFAALRQTRPLEVLAHHVRHGLRDSDAVDAEIARKTARLLDVPFVQTELHLKVDNNVEAQAREARFRALTASIPVDQRDHTVLATAHNGDENLETLFWRLSRGCGLEGATLAYQSNVDQVTRIRPLLFAGKSDIYAFLDQVGLNWAEDPTNQSDHYQRNRLRHHVLAPYLSECGDAAPIHASLTRLAADASALTSFADQFVAPQCHFGAWFCEKAAFDALTYEAQAQLLRHAARQCVHGYVPDAKCIHRALAAIHAPRQTQKHVTDQTVDFSWNRRGVIVQALNAVPTALPAPVEVNAACGTLELWGFAQVTVMRANCVDVPKNTVQQFTFELTNAMQTLAFVPAASLTTLDTTDGRTEPVTELLKKLGIPQPWQACWPVLCADGVPLWILRGPRSVQAKPPQPGQTMLTLFIR